MPNFTVTPLIGADYEIEGTDAFGKIGAVKVTSPAWLQVETMQAKKKADGIFADAVDEHFKTLLEAADEARKVASLGLDDLEFEVIEEGAEGTPTTRVQLDDAGKLIKAALTKPERLKWVGEELAILR